MKWIAVLVVLVSAVFLVYAEQGPGAALVYDISAVDYIDASVDSVVYLKTPSKIVSYSGDAAYDSAEVQGEGFYLYALYFKSTGQLRVTDEDGNGVLITVTNPEEVQQAQDYSARLQACEAELGRLRPLVSDLRNRTKQLEQNLTYYRGIVESNQTIVKTKYVLGEEEWESAMKKWRQEMSFREFAKMYIGHLIVIFLFGAFIAAGVIHVFSKLRFVPPA